MVSGGAAWSDHVAVQLFLNHPESKLTLCLPCEWDTKLGQHIDTGKKDWRVNPGQLANRYHLEFSKDIKQSSLAMITKAIALGAVIKAHKGFHARNLQVGKSDYLIAFSYSTTTEPTDGGTLHTWKHSRALKKHYSLDPKFFVK